MKRLNIFLHSSLIVLLLGTIQSKALSQCEVDYTTYNYFCDLDTLILEAVPLSGVAPFSFIWETGETTQSILIPLALGDYMLTMTDANGCVSIINCHIKPFPPVLFYPYNQNACEGDTVILWLDWFRDSLPGATYLWSTGETSWSITITDDITWSVTVTDPSTGCTYEIPPGLFDFHPTPYPTIVGPAMLCPGQTATLSVTGGPFGSIYWYPQEIYAPTLDITQPGIYTVYGFSLEAGYCWHLDTINILPGDIPPPILTGPINLCSGQNGVINITNSADYNSFLWSTGETSSSITVNQSGTYNVTVTNVGGCSTTGNITIAGGPGASISTNITPATCGQNNGSVDVSTTPPGSYTFLWSNGSSTEDIINIPGGSYAVTVTSTNGCTSTTVINVPDNPITINLSGIITPNTSCVSNDGGIDLNISPSGTYSYLWSNGATTEDLLNIAPGIYSVTVSTGVNCFSTTQFTVGSIVNFPELQTIPTPATCGENNGAINLQINNGAPPFTFLWSNGSTTQSLSNVPGNIYMVTVTGSNGCTSTSIIDLPDNTIPINISAIITPNTSCLSNNGAIDITTSPSGLYNFIWSNGETTEDLSNLTAGTYDLTVTLGNTCQQTGSFTLSNENIPFTVTASTLPNTSCTVPNGAIDLTISPAGTYSFEWSSGPVTEDLQNIGAGTYVVTITNTDGCTSTSSFDVLDTIPILIVSGISSPNTSCQLPNGSLDISVTPSGLYTFIWSNGSTGEDLQNVPSGDYTVTVTSAEGCITISAFTIINQSAGFSISGSLAPDTSCFNPSGSIDLTISPVGIYSILWSNGSTIEDIQSLSAGIYTVTVSDANNCISSQSYTIDNNISLPAISSLLTPETCGASNGNIDLTILPAGNSFLWSNGSMNEDLQGIPAGVYMVTVTSANGCTSIDTFTISNLNSNFTLLAVPTENNSCLLPNGTIDLTVSPSGVYTFLWSNGATTEDLQNLAPGQYQVTVTDQANCASTLDITIGNNISIPVISSLILPTSCSQTNGGIDLNITPAVGNTFIWSNGVNTEDLINIGSGNYSVTVTGSNGCSTTANFNVPNTNSNFSLTGIPNANTSCISGNGSIDLIVTPVGLYSYAWSNGISTQDLQNLVPGNYIVTVSDISNCTSVQSFTIDDNSVNPILTQTIVAATCGQNNGNIDITISPSSNYLFHWSNGSTNEDLTDVFPGVYSVTATDLNGCSVSSLFTMPNNNSNFTISSSVSDDQSCINSSGAIDLTIQPSGLYSYLWSNGSITEDLINLHSGIYEVTVTDNFNCSTSEIFSIENVASLPVLSGNIEIPSCGDDNGAILLTVNPENGNHFIWSNGETTQHLLNAIEGTYTVTVTDVNGCTTNASFVLPGSVPLQVTIDADLSAINNGVVTCSLQINVPITAIDSISWSPENIMSCHQAICMEQIFVLLAQTEVSVMVMDTNGCFGEASMMLDVDKEFKVFIPNVISANGDGINDIFTIFGNEEITEIVRLEIFDRWGNQVFINESFPPNDLSYGWDGVFRGQKMNPDVFAYWSIVRYSNGEEHNFKGDVTLLR